MNTNEHECCTRRFPTKTHVQAKNIRVHLCSFVVSKDLKFGIRRFSGASCLVPGVSFVIPGFSVFQHFPYFPTAFACLIIHSSFFGLPSAPYTCGTPLKYLSNPSIVTSPA